VSTLQQVAAALDVPINAFFEVHKPSRAIVFQKSGERQYAIFSYGKLADLGASFTRSELEPFIVRLEPNTDSGDAPIVHTGLEFVYCLEGRLEYEVDGQVFTLEEGDSLIFEAHLPHRWRNIGEIPSQSLLVLCASDARDRPDERHFVKEISY
jgi:uncharacterized cupin superfamily protein